jgi:four helix bundle protein
LEVTPLFTKTFDFVTWLIPATNHFPRSQRFLATERLLRAAFDFQELILEANNAYAHARLEKLKLADAALDRVRIYLRLALKWQWFSPGQYQHAAAMVTEMGRLLGGWQRSLRQSAA